MGSKTAKTSLWLVGLPQQWRGSSSQNGESTSCLPKKTFSRSQIVIRSINTACEATDETLGKIIEAFEDVYEVQAKLSMAKMATIVQELGLVTEKKTQRQSEATSLGMHILVA
jgi:hypothetical protein